MRIHARLVGVALAALLGAGALGVAHADHQHAQAPARSHVHVVADPDDPGGAHPGSPGTLSGD